jgi:hypothetical protein
MEKSQQTIRLHQTVTSFSATVTVLCLHIHVASRHKGRRKTSQSELLEIQYTHEIKEAGNQGIKVNAKRVSQDGQS